MNYFSAPGIIRLLDDFVDTPDRILKALSMHFGVDINKLTGKDRHAEIVYVRQLYCYIARTKCQGVPFKEIAKLINKDHSTAIHSIKEINRYIDTNHRLGRKAKELLKSI